MLVVVWLAVVTQTGIAKETQQNFDHLRPKNTAYNTRLAQWGLKWFIESLCFYCKFVLADNLVFQNPPLRQAWERYAQF